MSRLLRLLIRRFDAWLSRQHGVQVFTDDPLCLLRIQSSRVPHPLALPDGIVPRGADCLLLHLWNERVPPMPPEGPDLAWALETRRGIIHSLRLIARYLQTHPLAGDIQVVGGVTAHINPFEVDGGKVLLEHLGFSLMPYHRPAGAFGEFWENFYTWWLMWAFNPASTRRRSMFKLRRLEFWMSRGAFLEKYGQ